MLNPSLSKMLFDIVVISAPCYTQFSYCVKISNIIISALYLVCLALSFIIVLSFYDLNGASIKLIKIYFYSLFKNDFEPRPTMSLYSTSRRRRNIHLIN